MPDVATDAQLSDDCRRALLATGAHAVRSDPGALLAGSCTGVITLHWPDAGHRPTAAQAEALGLLASDTAAWLSWYHHRTVLLDALEHLHRTLARPAP
ncbi:hypothetical protein LT493_43130 [Streptomyces tricolor]|nr:hypothetical protein [Streptomyces tricolor]